ncbi:hypothetical protein BH11BAC3_BH11BAC3_39500 [soil metagenome]
MESGNEKHAIIKNSSHSSRFGNVGWYFVKFIGLFCLLYFGTKAIIGLAAPVGHYSPFIEHYFNYPAWLRLSLLYGTRFFAGLAGFDTYLRDAYHVAVVHGRGIHIVYACLGYGLLSFWIAFVFADNGSFQKKTAWMLGGCLVIWLINVFRMTLMLVAINKGWGHPDNLDHHTIFNVVVYLIIFLMIWMKTRPPTPEGE